MSAIESRESKNFQAYLKEKYPLRALPGISDKRERLFAELGVHNQVDLLYYFPRNYEDWSVLTPLSQIRESGIYTFQATIANRPVISRKGKLSWIRFRLVDHNYTLEVTIFNQAWLMDQLRVGDSFVFHGRVEVKGTRRSVVNPAYRRPEEAGRIGMLANYPLVKGLNQKIIRQGLETIIHSGLHSKLTDALPDFIREKFSLATLDFSLKNIHQAKNAHELRLARYRLAFDELFLMRAALELDHIEDISGKKAKALVSSKQVADKINNLRASLPFSLTNSQVHAINDVFRELRREKPMNRLLQGDVGSGKTMVAIFAMAYVGLLGGQSLFMVPTSVLAEQHMKTLTSYFSDLNIGVDLLLGATKPSERAAILERCASGETKVLLGTHALLQDDIHFANLLLTITDEQHRFGVRQRAKLGFEQSVKSYEPHRLHMSATPIPRSLAMIFFNDLDISLMQDMPSGRQEVITKVVKERELGKVYQKMAEEIGAGAQIYVVCPAIEESDSLSLRSAEETYEHLLALFPKRKIALMHGRMKQDRKESLMHEFIEGKIDILVSTTVIEVGVDNPNASLMLVLNAERFGLAQLHQLRGRVGRGTRQAYCYLQSDHEGELAKDRLETLVRYSDGFQLAEEDLRLRGPGDFLGTRQSGIPAFHLLNLYEDQEIISHVQETLNSIKALPQEAFTAAKKKIQRAVFERYPDLEQGLTI